MVIEWFCLNDFSFFINQSASNHFCLISQVLLLLFQGSLIEMRIIPFSSLIY